ncbi:MAG: nucleotidyltransferase domain-containing protein [bacterium]|nr:nucleotidyltransferase domain-containing protein [bacterium]
MTKQEIDQKIKNVADKIAVEYKPEKIILFGSFAWGNPTEDSDVDLFIVKRSKKKRADRGRELSSKLFGYEFPAMDILIYTPEEVEKSINEYKNLFIEDILRHGKVLYAKQKNAFIIALPKRPLNILH